MIGFINQESILLSCVMVFWPMNCFSIQFHPTCLVYPSPWCRWSPSKPYKSMTNLFWNSYDWINWSNIRFCPSYLVYPCLYNNDPKKCSRTYKSCLGSEASYSMIPYTTFSCSLHTSPLPSAAAIDTRVIVDWIQYHPSHQLHMCQMSHHEMSSLKKQ